MPDQNEPVTEDDEPFWDDTVAAGLIGSKVLIGLTYVRPEGDERVQMYGLVTAADRSGIEVVLGGQRIGENFRLPPDLQPFSRASPGEYRLRSTGEVVIDPDYTCSWTIHPPPH